MASHDFDNEFERSDGEFSDDERCDHEEEGGTFEQYEPRDDPATGAKGVWSPRKNAFLKGSAAALFGRMKGRLLRYQASSAGGVSALVCCVLYTMTDALARGVGIRPRTKCYV
jgi:hypothetical protein